MRAILALVLLAAAFTPSAQADGPWCIYEVPGFPPMWEIRKCGEPTVDTELACVVVRDEGGVPVAQPCGGNRGLLA